jgi:hypothetical protein
MVENSFGDAMKVNILQDEIRIYVYLMKYAILKRLKRQDFFHYILTIKKIVILFYILH